MTFATSLDIVSTVVSSRHAISTTRRNKKVPIATFVNATVTAVLDTGRTKISPLSLVKARLANTSHPYIEGPIVETSATASLTIVLRRP